VRTHDFRSTPRFLLGAFLAAGLSSWLPTPAAGGVKVVETEDFRLELGMRLQPRLEYRRFSLLGNTEWERDFMVRRARLKANGKMLTAIYGFEWKIDGTDQIAAVPSAQVENAWIQIPLGAGLEIKAGLYDQPFSRDRLTSDSRQLAVDRTEVSGVPDALGLADNATGFQLQGKVHKGRAQYWVGGFDNRRVRGIFQNAPMAVGRLDLNFGATTDIYQDAHFGDASWYSVGINGSYQGSIEDSTGVDDGKNAAVGIDGMVDVPAGPGRLFLRGEANMTSTERPAGGNTLDTRVWMLGLGYLTFGQRFQPMVVFDQVRRDDAEGGVVTNVTYVGANFYRKQHSLKLQGDVRLEAGNGESVDGGRLQLQVDF
jgi:phosphate-selective porin O/P